MSRAPANPTSATRTMPRPNGVSPSPATRWPSTTSAQHANVVREAPPMSWMWVGPQAVTSWPNRRCQMSSSGNPASAITPHAESSTAPTGTDQLRREPHRRRTPPVAEDHRQQRAEGDAVEPDDDEPVRRVGERPRVAAAVDVPRDVPVVAPHRDQQAHTHDPDREHDPGRQAGALLGDPHERVEPPVAPVQVADEHDDAHGGERHEGGEDDLADVAAAGGWRLGLRATERAEEGSEGGEGHPQSLLAGMGESIRTGDPGRFRGPGRG